MQIVSAQVEQLLTAGNPEPHWLMGSTSFLRFSVFEFPSQHS